MALRQTNFWKKKNEHVWKKHNAIAARSGEPPSLPESIENAEAKGKGFAELNILSDLVTDIEEKKLSRQVIPGWV